MTELQRVTLAVASAHLGKKEFSGRNDGPFIEMIQHWLDQGAGWMERQPWCAAFATWCVYQAAAQLGITPSLPKSGSSTSLYAWFKKHAQLLDTPVPGCIGLERGDGGSPGKTHHHTFLVEKVDGEWVYGIDGNWKNAVSRTVRLRKGLDFGRIS